MKERIMSVFNTLCKSIKFENAVLFLYLVKCLVISVSYEDAAVFVALATLSGFKTYNKRFDIRDSLDEKYKKEMAQELKDLKQTLSVTRLGQGAKQSESPKRYF